MRKKVIELVRVSTEGQAAEDRASIPAQRAINKRTAEQYELEITRTIELADVSGAAVLHTPEMKELLRWMESPDIHGVITREFSRLMRPENFSDYALLQAFVDTNTILYLPEGPIDLASKSGRLLGTIRAAIAGLERTEILERVWAAKEQKRRAGGCPQSAITLPYGVCYSRERGWYYEPEAEKVREAFRLFLSGETSYWAVGRKLGIEPYNLRIILRNPIYTGWRVIDKRRDPSPGAHHSKPNGRQADRPKIPRTPEEVIRVKVIGAPLISDDEFQRVQKILELKKQKHWRAQAEYAHRFTYNGFLVCGDCGNLIYTHVRHPHDWYVCKSRMTAERLSREQHGLRPCNNPYMRRERLEAQIDELIAERLTDMGFVGQIAAECETRSNSKQSQSTALRIQRELKRLEGKRKRVLESYFEGLIGREERDRRLREIEEDTSLYSSLLLKEHSPTISLTPEILAEAFSPFYEWAFLQRAQKRRLLASIIPEIHIRSYQVQGISLLCRDEVSRTGRDSSPWQA